MPSMNFNAKSQTIMVYKSELNHVQRTIELLATLTPYVAEAETLITSLKQFRDKIGDDRRITIGKSLF